MEQIDEELAIGATTDADADASEDDFLSIFQMPMMAEMASRWLGVEAGTRPVTHPYSDNLINCGRALRAALGTTLYNYFAKTVFPLPLTTTLQRRRTNLPVTRPGVINSNVTAFTDWFVALSKPVPVVLAIDDMKIIPSSFQLPARESTEARTGGAVTFGHSVDPNAHWSTWGRGTSQTLNCASVLSVAVLQSLVRHASSKNIAVFDNGTPFRPDALHQLLC
jgi:hypothetical protein